MTFRIADSPFNFQNAKEVQLKSTDGYAPTSSPYNVWTPIGASSGATANGAIVVTALSTSDFFISRDLGATWTRAPTVQTASYSRSLSVGFNPKDIVAIGGGPFQGDGTRNAITIVAQDVNGCKTCS